MVSHAHGRRLKTATYSGVVGTPLTATAIPRGLVLAGEFGMFLCGRPGGALLLKGWCNHGEAHVRDSDQPVQLQTTVQAPPNTMRVSVHLVDAQGLDRGPLGEVLVNPPPKRTAPTEQ